MRKMGEHREAEARQDFTLLILTNAVVGAVMMLLGYGFMEELLGTMGLSPAVFSYCHTYLGNYLLFTIPILLMYNFSLVGNHGSHTVRVADEQGTYEH